jgi:hypothetical protein
LGDALASLLGKREDADYTLDLTLADRHAADACLEAVDMLKELGSLSAADVGKGVERYLEKVHTWGKPKPNNQGH